MCKLSAYGSIVIKYPQKGHIVKLSIVLLWVGLAIPHVVLLKSFVVLRGAVKIPHSRTNACWETLVICL